MARRLRQEEVVTIEVLYERGCCKREIARQLGIDEKAVRYWVQRRAQSVRDGRAHKPFAADVVGEAIATWMQEHVGAGLNLAVLHEHLCSEHGYGGSYKSVQRYVRAKFPRPKLRVRRRVETPPGAQGQADWAEFRSVRVGGQALICTRFT
jgi:transposase